MGVKPFPFPLNVGTDICRISRVFRILAGRHASRFASRILTPEEIAAAPIARLPPTLPTTLVAGYGLREGVVDFSTLKKTDPDLWTRATFLAGRCVFPLFLSHRLLLVFAGATGQRRC